MKNLNERWLSHNIEGTTEDESSEFKLAICLKFCNNIHLELPRTGVLPGDFKGRAMWNEGWGSFNTVPKLES